MATITGHGAVAGVQAKGFTVMAVQAEKWVHSLTAALASADQIIMGKVANGMTIFKMWANFGAGTGNDLVMHVGYDASLSAFGSATAAAGVVDLTKGLPYTVSLSDDAITQFAKIKVTCAALTSASATGAITLWALLAPDT